MQKTSHTSDGWMDTSHGGLCTRSDDSAGSGRRPGHGPGAQLWQGERRGQGHGRRPGHRAWQTQDRVYRAICIRHPEVPDGDRQPISGRPGLVLGLLLVMEHDSAGTGTRITTVRPFSGRALRCVHQYLSKATTNN